MGLAGIKFFNAADGCWYELTNDKWITVHPNGEGTKGTHLHIEDGESVGDALQRKFGYAGKGQLNLFKKKDFKQKDKKAENNEYNRTRENKELFEQMSSDYQKLLKTYKEAKKQGIPTGELERQMKDLTSQMDEIKKDQRKVDLSGKIKKNKAWIDSIKSDMKRLKDGSQKAHHEQSIKDLEKEIADYEKELKELDYVDNPSGVSFEEYKKRSEREEERYKDWAKDIINPDGSLKTVKKDKTDNVNKNKEVGHKEAVDALNRGDYVELWGSYYRKKDGKVEVLDFDFKDKGEQWKPSNIDSKDYESVDGFKILGDELPPRAFGRTHWIGDKKEVYDKFVNNPKVVQSLVSAVQAQKAENKDAKIGDTIIDSDGILSRYSEGLSTKGYDSWNADKAEKALFKKLKEIEKEYGFKGRNK